MSDEDSVAEVRMFGPLYGWICSECDEIRTGFGAKDVTRKSAEEHAMVKHSPPIGAPGSGRSSMKLYVEWLENGE